MIALAKSDGLLVKKSQKVHESNTNVNLLLKEKSISASSFPLLELTITHKYKEIDH